jgi:hypothetical protein
MTIHSSGATGWLIGTFVVGALVGCGAAESETADFATLPRARQTHHTALRDELARLVAEQATPELFTPSRGVEAWDYGADQRLADALQSVLTPPALNRALRQLDRAYPQGRFAFDPISLPAAIAVSAQYQPQRDQYRALFGQDELPLALDLTSGLLADLSLLDHATCFHRLEAIAAGEALQAGHPEEVVASLGRMLRVDTRLAGIPHVGSRLLAARLRHEALRVLEAVAEHPRATPAVLVSLRQLLETSLAQWTPDRHAWEGDRILGLHAYEMIRDNQLLNVLTAREIDALKRDGKLEPFVTAVMQGVDDDQWFYLHAMRQVIDHCDRPFFERRKVLDQIAAELESLRATSRFPIFAARVLLPNLLSGHRAQALDRARCEAWTLALSAATGRPVNEPPVNPVTGVPFRLGTSERSVEVESIDGLDPGEHIRIPRLIDNPHGNQHKSD